ncbi:MAG TPA: S8 family serine peptidase [Vicinamibacterales bacterium]|jgi:serine protease|nr:S8 family serine peptidase [Vicinamibacterales bacterium]
MSLELAHPGKCRHVLLLAALIAGIGVAGTVRRVRAQAGDQSFPVMGASRAWAFVQAADHKLDYLPGEVLVKFKAGTGVAGQQRALMALRSRPAVTDLNWIAANIALHRDTAESDSTILAAQLREQPEVDYAEPNYLRHTTYTPTAPGYAAHQWNLAAIDMPRAWDINTGGSSNLIVAVVDTGVTTVNNTFNALTWNGNAIQSVAVPFQMSPDFPASRLVGPADFISSGVYSSVVVDTEGHGTHVASTIGESATGLAESGVAFNVKIMPVKVCVSYWDVQFALSASGTTGYAPLSVDGSCSLDAIVQGIRYAADNGAKVINLSIGGTRPSSLEQDAIVYAVGKGAFVSISAGNCGAPNSSECPPTQVNPVIYPAAFAATIDGAMSVGAVGPSLTRSYYSSYGSYLESVAPGGNDLEGGASGMIWQATICFRDSDIQSVLFPRFDRYCGTPYEGTSMASPHVAGTAALIYSQGVTSPAAIEALIEKTARPLGTGGRNDEYGYGLVQPRSALFGFGIAK